MLFADLFAIEITGWASSIIHRNNLKGFYMEICLGNEITVCCNFFVYAKKEMILRVCHGIKGSSKGGKSQGALRTDRLFNQRFSCRLHQNYREQSTTSNTTGPHTGIFQKAS